MQRLAGLQVMDKLFRQGGTSGRQRLALNNPIRLCEPVAARRIDLDHRRWTPARQCIRGRPGVDDHRSPRAIGDRPRRHANVPGRPRPLQKGQCPGETYGDHGIVVGVAIVTGEIGAQGRRGDRRLTQVPSREAGPIAAIVKQRAAPWRSLVPPLGALFGVVKGVRSCGVGQRTHRSAVAPLDLPHVADRTLVDQGLHGADRRRPGGRPVDHERYAVGLGRPHHA